MPETAPDFNHNQPIYTVTEVASALKRTVEDRFGVLRLRGEISGFKRATSGHVYFRLKDEGAVMDAVMWRGTAGKLTIPLEDGLEVIATGRMTTYPGKSSYQIVVEHLEPAGVGALMALLEQRKKTLAAEGLFDPARKKALPLFPRVVGVVTSPTGAVIRDILHRIDDRFPCHVLVWPVPVQGEGAAEKIAAAIAGFNAMQGLRPDVLIVARGGGSIEDLWAFNEEVVVRAAATSQIPLISAVGHETDTTLIDYASDMRAPTPTAAAELAVPVRHELLTRLSELSVRLYRVVQLVQALAQRLDDWTERLLAALPNAINARAQKLSGLQLNPQMIMLQATRRSERLEELLRRGQQAMLRQVDQSSARLERFAAVLAQLDYRKTLSRGFVLVRKDGALVKNAADAEGALTLVFHDGEVKVNS